MEKLDLKNKELDEIGRGLVEASRLTGDDLEKIVSKPHLFWTVQARIAAERQVSEKALVKTRTFAFWNWKTGAAAFSAAAVVLIVMSGFIFSNRRPVSEGVAATDVPKQKKSVKEIAHNLPGDETAPVIEEEKQTEFKNTKLVFNDRSENKPVIRKSSAQRPPQNNDGQNAVQTPFYPLTYTGDVDGSVVDGQVVRVELPRATLYAMGVDLPVDNGRDTVKTELLISSDGVTKAIRLVE